MAKNGQFALCIQVLVVLAAEPDRMQTSAVIAEALGSSAVMVRRVFLMLSRAGLIVQRKGPSGGARLKLQPKEIGLGEVYAATTGNWLDGRETVLEPLLRRAEARAVKAMNETTLSQVIKRLKKV